MSSSFILIRRWACVALFSALVACTPSSPAISDSKSTASPAADQPIVHSKGLHIIVLKSKRQLQVFDGNTLVQQFPIGLGFNPIGDKSVEGDGATPEGDYYITHKNPNSNYYLSLGVSYPNQADAERGIKAKRIDKTIFNQIVQAQKNQSTPPQKTALGGEIFIHGKGSSRDWTWGCMALDDADMKKLFELIPEKTPIRIHP